MGINNAIDNWNEVKNLTNSAASAPVIHHGNDDSIQSKSILNLIRSLIPIRPFIENGSSEVDEIFALVVDMQKSSLRMISKEIYPNLALDMENR